MAEETQFFVAMVETGEEDDEASFRLRNVPEGEMQRQHVLQQEASNLGLQADLVSVVHGTLSPDGPAATILVIDFRFQGSRSRGRRFREATIAVQFAHGDSEIGGTLDPEVVSIVPFGSFSRNPSSQEIATTISANLAANPGGFVDIGGSWQRMKSMQKVKFTTLHGMKRIEGRVYGTQNSAQWKLAENDNDRHGIPSVLRVAILVKPKSSDSFRASIAVDVKTDLIHGAIMSVKRFRGRAIVDPVYFDEEDNREPLNPELLGKIDLENLSEFDLEGIVSIGPSVSTSLTLPSQLYSWRSDRFGHIRWNAQQPDWLYLLGRW
ncbi:hypothetical protein FN846DRAFT_885568 [Sphaerosporella brunnea]|uniref:Uncharacterized protein n=1 Tax=Sphaerosporella brunnea TaxID=1250544 RepID=A0A5J5FCA2_9PEZI|nr:hypothetical protein FN846DRAFT_885568 [Sphaerosporella brunnea]